MNKNTAIIIGIGILIILLILIIALTVFKTPTSNTIQNPVPIQTMNPSINPKIIKQPSGFKIDQTIPNLSQKNFLRIDEPFVIRFSKPINPIKLSYNINENVKITTALDISGTELTFNGDPFWPQDIEIKLIIRADTQSQDGDKLNSDYSFQYRTGIPESAAQ